MFGRRKKQQETEEAAREAERRALFVELAKRPDTVCPFLGLEDARTEYRDRVSDSHRCYAFGDPAELSAEQQQKVCLQRGYGNCPRYLRGVLVIPTEELEALRRPVPAPPPPAPAPAPAESGGGGRRGLVAALLVLLLALGGGAGAFILLGLPGEVAQETPTPDPTTPSPEATPSPSAEPPTPEPTDAPTPEPTPIAVPSTSGNEIPPLPTPEPGDSSTGYAVFVTARSYPVLLMDEDGNVRGSASANFDHVSAAPVQRIELDGDLYWRTLQGGYTDRAYSRALSNGFFIFETYENAAGEARFRPLEEDEY